MAMGLRRMARLITGAGRALTGHASPTDDRRADRGMTPEEKFQFDLEGYLVVKQVLSAAEVFTLNAIAEKRGRDEALSPGRTYGRVFRASAWGPPYQALIDHPRIVPYLVELVGPRFRLDHDYFIFMTRGGTGQELHGGEGDDNPDHWYTYRDGVMRNGLTVVTFCLSRAGAGDGGFCCIPGSHKSHFPGNVPADVRSYRRRPHYLIQPPLDAGDAVIFTEALIHGTAPWTAGSDRRALLYKYSPGHSAWMSEYYAVGEYPALTEQQKRILAPPYVGERPDSVSPR